MKFKILSLIILFSYAANSIVAQENEQKQTKFTGSILFGKGQSLSGNIVPNSPDLYSWSVNGNAPTASGISLENSIINMTGAEFRYFLTNKFALKLSGCGIIRNTPAQDNVPGVITGNNSAAWIPAYEATNADNSIDANINFGFEYHLVSESKLSPYVGIAIPFCYSRYSQYNPTINYNTSGDAQIADVGFRHIEAMGFGGQLVLGSDYSLTNSLYLGFEIKPISYLYAMNTKYPAPGLEARSADTHTYGFFTQPVLKLGIKF